MIIQVEVVHCLKSSLIHALMTVVQDLIEGWTISSSSGIATIQCGDDTVAQMTTICEYSTRSRHSLPIKHGTLAQLWFTVGPISHVCWVNARSWI